MNGIVMIIRVNRLLWSAELAGFHFDGVILNEQNELVFVSKSVDSNTETRLQDLAAILSAFLKEVRRNDTIHIDPFHERFDASDERARQAHPLEDSNGTRRGFIREKSIARREDVESFAEIIADLVSLSETTTFIPTTVPELDPKIATESPTSAAFLSVIKVQPTVQAPQTETTPHDPRPQSGHPKPHGWLIDAVRRFAIANRLKKGVTVPTATIQRFIDGLPASQRTTVESARVKFAELGYKRPRVPKDR